ncbi:MAG: hypothetical protein JW871_05365 [Endomicrobiales bacterium]|nr:hypothetical protein [Endomicrobiales bacterium]
MGKDKNKNKLDKKDHQKVQSQPGFQSQQPQQAQSTQQTGHPASQTQKPK